MSATNGIGGGRRGSGGLGRVQRNNNRDVYVCVCVERPTLGRLWGRRQRRRRRFNALRRTRIFRRALAM